MTVALNIKTVADNIANISIAGVTIKSVGGVPQSGTLITPIMFPQPSGFISNIEVVNQSFSGAADAKIDFSYTLHYVFLFAEIGGGISPFDPYSPLIQKLELIFETIITNRQVTGLVDLALSSVDGIGEIEDPSGNIYWGALFSFRCLEFAQ